MENENVEKIIAHLNRIINNLNQHWHSIELLLSHVSKPLLVDDRGLANVLFNLKTTLEKYTEDLKEINLIQTLSEIKYIGKRLSEIENKLAEINKNGISKQIKLDFRCDGYELVKKQTNYQKEDPIDEPYENLKKVLNTLSNRESQVIIHRLGLFGEKRKTYKKIGEIINVSSSRTNQIYQKAIRKLRHPKIRELVIICNNQDLKKEIFGE